MTSSRTDFAPTARPRLVAILATPPLATSGTRTRRRLERLAPLLGCEQVVIANLLRTPTADVIAISSVGAAQKDWVQSRQGILDAIHLADHVLLAWGTTEPTGTARNHHRDQVEWVLDAVARCSVPVWTVGGTPRHPSRWQRFTSRHLPGVAFDVALRGSLVASIPVRSPGQFSAL
ncbi:DUF1643 domain-containing protein [Micromonospora sp. DT81.3]|uniref:DUF1643 domain-containing protein n=1 Tax=Micromonospora sp. DT81.3 TaxID=3416523 RepID=UPI003CF9A6E8